MVLSGGSGGSGSGGRGGGARGGRGRSGGVVIIKDVGMVNAVGLVEVEVFVERH